MEDINAFCGVRQPTKICGQGHGSGAALCDRKGETFEGEGFTDPEALTACCRRELFDAIVLDVEMPGKNGIETAQEIGRVQPHTPIIF